MRLRTSTTSQARSQRIILLEQKGWKNQNEKKTVAKMERGEWGTV